MLNDNKKFITLKVDGFKPIKVKEKEDGTMAFYNEYKMLLAEDIVEYKIQNDNGTIVLISNDNRYFVFGRYSELILEGEIFDKWRDSIRAFLLSDNMFNTFLNLKEEDFKCTPFIDDCLKILRRNIEDKLANDKSLTDEERQKEENELFNMIANKIASSDPDLVKPAIEYLNSGRELNI